MRAHLAAVLFLVSGLVCAGPALAREVTATEKAALTQAIADFSKAMRANNYGRVTDASYPPRMFQKLADDAKIEPKALRKAIVDESVSTMRTIKLVSFDMDLAKAKHRELPDGEPYLLIPTQSVLGKDGLKYLTRTETVAKLDGGKWYLMRVASADQAKLVTEVYPGFAGVQFAEATREVME